MTSRPVPGRLNRAFAPRALLGAVVLGLALAAPAAALGQTADFAEPPTSPESVDGGPASLAVGDFDGDLRTDLAVAGVESDAVSILLGDGTGDLAAAPSSPEAAGDDPSSIATGDFNGDPHADLAIANHTSDDVSILLGDGTGEMTPAPTSPEAAGDGPSSVAVGDFDEDGDADLAVAATNGDRVAILLGDGTGDFTAVSGTPERTGESPGSVALGDFDADGKLDLAAANKQSDDVTIRLGDGTGDFKEPDTSPERADDTPVSVGVADFNRDGRDDLAAVNFASGNLTIMLAVGSNGDFARAPTSPEATGTNPSHVQVSDLDADGLADLAIANFFSDDVTIRRGDGTGNFKEPPSSPERAGNSPQGLAAGDFDGDDIVDLAVANRDSDDVTLLLNTVAKGGGPTCRGERATMVGTADDDDLTGTSRADVIVARAGDDVVRGRGEDDVICGNRGKDDLRGGDGWDDLDGDVGPDELHGDKGADELRGDKGDDFLSGGDGDDFLRGGPDRDRCSGGAGGDDVEGCR